MVSFSFKKYINLYKGIEKDKRNSYQGNKSGNFGILEFW